MMLTPINANVTQFAVSGKPTTNSAISATATSSAESATSNKALVEGLDAM